MQGWTPLNIAGEGDIVGAMCFFVAGEAAASYDCSYQSMLLFKNTFFVDVLEAGLWVIPCLEPVVN